MTLIVDCRSYSRRRAEGAIEGAGLLERLSARLHWLVCPACRAFTRQLAALAAAARRLAGPDPARLKALVDRLLGMSA